MTEQTVRQDYGVIPMLEARCMAGRMMYFAANFGNCIYALDLETGILKVLGFLEMPPEDYKTRPPVGAMERCGNMLAIAPIWGDLFHLFDLRTGTCRNIPSPTKGPRQYNYSLPHGDEVIFIRWKEPGLARMNVPEGTIRYDNSFAAEMISHGQTEESWGRIDDAVIVPGADGRDQLYMVNVNNPWLMIYDLWSGAWRFHRIPGVADDNGFAEIFRAGAWFYLTSRNTGIIVKWNPATDECRQLENREGWMPRGAYLRFMGGRLFSMHCGTLEAFRENPEREAMEAVQLDERIPVPASIHPWLQGRLLWMEPYDDGICFYFMDETPVVYQTDYDLRLRKTIPVRMAPEDWQRYQQHIPRQFMEERIRGENTWNGWLRYTLDNYLDIVGQVEPLPPGRNDTSCGEAIYRRVMG